MVLLGTFALFLALGLAVYGLLASVWGARRDYPLLVESGRTAAYSLFLLVAAANVVMLAAILQDDFSVRYVAENSSRVTPLFFKFLSLWSAHEGSLLLWNLVLSGYLAAVAFRFRRHRPETLPWALGVMFAVTIFYLLLVLGPSQAFTSNATVPSDGRGPQPLLQNNWLMAVHPPLLYLGYIGFTVPFAFAMASLLTGATSNWWISLTRRWALAAWSFLTAGLLLGALWSYSVLGWGGYWAWDPVENVALLPWLVGTAFVHSSLIQERRDMLKVFNLCLAIGAFALTTFGTFLTRGNIIASVHAFTRSLVGPFYLGFLVLVLAAGYGLVAARSNRLRSSGRYDAAISREAAFLGNNWALLAIAFVVLLGTLFPLALEALTTRQVTVGGPYFDQTSVPPFLALLLLMGLGPLIPWRKGSISQLQGRAAIPAVLAAVVVVVLVATGGRRPLAIAAVGLAVFVFAGNAAALLRSLKVDGRALSRGFLVGLPEAFRRNRRLHGGLIVHMGVAVATVAITASTFQQQAEVTLTRGQSIPFAGYTIRYDGLVPRPEAQRMVLQAPVSIAKGGKSVGTMTPALNLYPSATEPIGTPAVRSGWLVDFYVSLLGLDERGEAATFRLFLNPGVSWLWIGGAIMALGGLVALWPARRRSKAAPVAVAEPQLAEIG
jgi:cytochrome c-type biogenesis protein CcmF